MVHRLIVYDSGIPVESSVQFWPDSDQQSIAIRRDLGLDFSLLRHLKRIVDLDAKVSYCALKLGMAE